MANIKFSQFTVGNTQSDIDFVVGYKGPDNVQISPTNLLASSLGNYLPLAGGTMTGNIASGDNVRATYGTGADLNIYHDGSTSRIQNTTGDIRIMNFQDDGSIIISSDDGSGGVATYMTIDGAEEQVRFFKPTEHGDGVLARFGDSGDLRIYHDGSNSHIQANGTGDLFIQQFRNDGDIVFQSDNGSGGTDTYFKLWGLISSLAVYKDMLFVNDGNGGKLKFGASQDLQIYHDGSNSFIADTGTGKLKVLASQFDIINAANSEFMAEFIENAEVKLYYNNSKKFETTSTGVSVTNEIKAITNGTLFLDNTNNNNPYYLYNSGSNLASLQIGRGTSPGSNVAMAFDNSGNVGIGTTSPTTKLHIDESGTTSPALFIDTARYGAYIIGDGTSNSQYLLNLQSNGGSTEVMRVQSSGNVGIGTTSPQEKLDISGGSIRLDDNQKITWSTNDSNIGRVRITGNESNDFLTFVTDNSEKMRINSLGNVGIGTTSPAVKLDVVGTIDTDNLTISGNQGTVGQVLTSTGTGVQWQTGGGGASSLNDLSDVLIDGTSNYFVNIPAGLSGNPVDNLIIGDNAGNSLTDGFANICIGADAGDAITTGDNIVCLGVEAGSGHTTNGNSVYIGYRAGLQANAGNSVIIGSRALDALSGAWNNHCVIGEDACTATISRNEHHAFGYEALRSQTSGERNSAFGAESLELLTTGVDNCAFGHNAGDKVTGDQNTLIGSSAGSSGTNDLTSGDANILIGYNSAASSATVSNEVNLYNGSVTARFQGAAAAWSFVSDARDKKDIEDLELGLDFVNKLKPRKFKWDLRDSDVDKDKEASGFIAQEVKEVLDEMENDYTGIVDTNNPDQYTVSQANIIPMLVKAIQELKAEIELLKSK